MKKTFLTLLFLATFATLKAQTHYAIFNHVALDVRHIDKSVAFYSRLFKLDSIPNPFPHLRVTWFKIGEHDQLHLIQAEPGEKILTPENLHICFSVKSIDEFISRLQKEHIAYTNGDGKANAINLRTDGVKQIYFHDPDGYLVEVNDQQY
jgi:lactoylglutathione lyase